MITIAVGEDKRVHAVKTVRDCDIHGFYEKVTQTNDITDHALDVIAKYMTDNNLEKVETEFGVLILQKTVSP